MKILVLLSFLFITSCSGIQPINRSGSWNPDSVDLNGDGIMDESDIKIKEETVILGPTGGRIYRSFEENDYKRDNVAEKMKIGLSLGPGLYRSANYISLLKFLDRESLSPKVISGTEFGAIVAAMYASGMTPEMIEWHFFKYLREKPDSEVFENSWIEDIDKHLLSQIRVKNIEDTKVKFYLTLYDPIVNKTYFFDKGNIRELLKLNLRLSNKKSIFKNTSKYISALRSEIYNPAIVKKLGADFVIGADVLGDNYKLKTKDKLVSEVFETALREIEKIKDQFDYYYSLGQNSYEIDSNDKSPNYLLETNKYINNHKNELKKLIHNKYIEKYDLNKGK